MRRTVRVSAKALQATLLTLLGAGLLVAATQRPYVIITLDGHRVLAESKPRVEGLAAYVRLMPTRQLAVLQEEMIDWKATEAANAAGEPIAIPSGSTFVDKGKPKAIIHTITGKPTPVNTDAPANQPPEDTLQARYDGTLQQRQQSRARRLQLQEELKALQAAGPAAAGGEDQRASRANELRKSIEELDMLIAKLAAEIEAIEREAAFQGVELK